MWCAVSLFHLCLQNTNNGVKYRYIFSTKDRLNMILEIGSGHKPRLCSDVLVDKYLDNFERVHDLKTYGKPLIVSDVQDLPIKNNAFDHSICSHILEHLEAPEVAVKEITRVSRQGYIETPSAIKELLEPHRGYHKWLVVRSRNKLLFFKKRKEMMNYSNPLLQKLIEKNLGFRLFVGANPDLWITRMHWKKSIEVELIHDYSINDLIDHYLKYASSGFFKTVTTMTKTALELAFNGILPVRRKTVKLEEIPHLLFCPRCRSDLHSDHNMFYCEKCRKSFPFEKGIIRF